MCLLWIPVPLSNTLPWASTLAVIQNSAVTVKMSPNVLKYRPWVDDQNHVKQSDIVILHAGFLYGDT